jgi:predicted DNA-binding protein
MEIKQNNANVKRELLQVDGISQETKKALQKAALEKYGQPNASLLVRTLIADYLAQAAPLSLLNSISETDVKDTVRVEFRLPRIVFNRITKLAETRLSPRNYYIASIIMAHVGQSQLQGDAIESLRQSNYEMSKIGTNLNQIAKAFNILVNGGTGNVPEIGKKLASLRREITAHIGRVLKVLDSGTISWEIRQGRNQKLKKGRVKTKDGDS